ncbi:hypothetical protein JRO89_XS03G0230600 [Xanthoceras sorbifolium]|uniref:ABC1 family protein n=1 Tax=Xanthoceras sorbifolium TaxID=99658 RepID=A0ABQ8IBE1_9ROSI|nr:hypothetical protein JRO89_XS03G0230600 [Xanthoceras sorbifolium]
MGWGNIYRRRLKVFTVTLIIYLDYKAVQQREKWTKKSKRSALWEKAHERNAKRVLSLIIELEGLWVKLGQYLSTRADVLPGAYIVCLKQLQDSLPPRSLHEVCQTIQKELGKPMDDLFTDFVQTPLATASIAQVHRATLVNGKEVVVKVQHMGIKEIILEDLKNAKSIVDWIAWAEPQYDFNPMIDEWCKEAPKELDFNTEAVTINVSIERMSASSFIELIEDGMLVVVVRLGKGVIGISGGRGGVALVQWGKNTRTVSRNLGCQNKGEDNKPAHEVDSTETVLVLEYMDGIRLNDSESLEAYDVNKQKIVEEITRAYAHQIYVDGFFNGDPHPGNFLVSKEPPHRPILLDFGLTKKLSSSVKQALAKMFLASAEGDHVALLSAFAEMGLKLRLDLPEQAMDVTSVFFRNSTPANEAYENVKNLAEQRAKNMKVDAFPGDIVIFSRVLNLLRGLSSSMNVRIVYMDIMRPFAESVLKENINKGPAVNARWIHETPVHSDVEAKLRQFLLELGKDDKILGMQVCAYKDGKVIIDTAAGVLGKYDPRPVQPDSLFPVFSVTKGITAGMVHWLVDNGIMASCNLSWTWPKVWMYALIPLGIGKDSRKDWIKRLSYAFARKLKLEDNVANIWPEFSSNGKHLIKVHHVLNHTSGLHNALADLREEDPLLFADWDECLKRMAMAAPETEPGQVQLYHYLSFGWLCGGIIEHVSGKKFQEVLEEAFIHPLNIEGELYVGIPAGVESRLAALTLDTSDLSKLSELSTRSDLPSTFQAGNISQLVTAMPALFNMLNIRRAIIPAANGHCSARALARYYAALADGGAVPPPHSRLSKPPLGSHPHIPKFPSNENSKNSKGRKSKDNPKHSKDFIDSIHNRNASTDSVTMLIHDGTSPDSSGSLEGGFTQSNNDSKIFCNPRIHDAFLGVGDFENLTIPNGRFGLGFKQYKTKEGSFIGFGHSGMGGSTGYCDVKNRFSIAVTLNKMSFGSTTGRILHFICSELNLPMPEEYLRFGEKDPDTLDLAKPLIN